ncbi:restriction endonuclease subunit S [Brachyspira pilosicoli]|uniref:restriction endonuclease subunit S n=1 Tax=Brachyspira pilosicoli TaxID=52584 RepID=UPI0012F4B267|nr:restriction endonuclease subunit S [Brachyspira pilosicoli]
MSKLEELLKKHCPNGAEYKALSDLGSFYAGLNGKNKDDFKDGNAKYITYMNVFSNLSVNININDTVQIGEKEKQNIVKYGDVIFTGSSETIEECGMSSVVTNELNEKLYLNSFCFGFRFNEPEIMLPDFSKYLFRSTELRKKIIKTASGVTRFNVSKKKMEKILIPLPPIEVQKEIVRILDEFTEKTTKLQELLHRETILRKKQYEYYRDKLLTFNDDVEWKNLSEIAEIGTGSSNTNEEIENGKYPFFVRSQEVRSKNEYEYDETAIITSGDGVGVGKIFHYIEGKYALHQRAYRIHIIDENVIPKYYFYYMKTTFLSYIEKTSFHSSVTSIRRPMLDNYPVPVPPLEEQERIVNILDKFDALCNDITKGLPAEIELRKKQYEYYRDKLLTFKEKKK